MFMLAYFEFKTLKIKKNEYISFKLYVMFWVIMTSGPIKQHIIVGPARCTP